jgi:hypothetical protein
MYWALQRLIYKKIKYEISVGIVWLCFSDDGRM